MITVLSSSLRHTSLVTHGEGHDYSTLFKSQTHLTCYPRRRTRLQCSLQVLHTSHATHGEGKDYSALFKSQAHLTCYPWRRKRLQYSLQVLDTPYLLNIEKKKITGSLQVLDTPHLLHVEKEKITVLSSSLRHTSLATHGEGQDYSAFCKSQTHLICYTWRRTRLQCSLQVLDTPHLLHMEKHKIIVLSSSLRHTSLATHGEGQDYSALFKSQAHLTCYTWRRRRLQCFLQVLDTPHLLHMEKEKLQYSL